MYDVKPGSIYYEFLKPGIYWRKNMPDLKNDVTTDNLKIIEFCGQVVVEFCGGVYSGGTFAYDPQEFLKYHVPDMRVPDTAKTLFSLFGAEKMEHYNRHQIPESL